MLIAQQVQCVENIIKTIVFLMFLHIQSFCEEQVHVHPKPAESMKKTAKILKPMKNYYREKVSTYECGFEPFQDSRSKFEVKFYLVAILFIIFDLEIIFLFPWAVAFDQVGLFGFLSMMFFLLVLTIGFAYEWMKGALDWS